MALDANALSDLIMTELESAGFAGGGQYSRAQEMADAIAEAVVSHIQASAEVPVTSGSSAGTYKVT